MADSTMITKISTYIQLILWVLIGIPTIAFVVGLLPTIVLKIMFPTSFLFYGYYAIFSSIINGLILIGIAITYHVIEKRN